MAGMAAQLDSHTSEADLAAEVYEYSAPELVGHSQYNGDIVPAHMVTARPLCSLQVAPWLASHCSCAGLQRV